ncbi:hypothetical protein DFJ77DRAFT_451159 [Powellomyces hirtus]|nr:hypothetical protein DFJ77DRAFT_451159 [Powellomyces hirtus]
MSLSRPWLLLLVTCSTSMLAAANKAVHFASLNDQDDDTLPPERVPEWTAASVVVTAGDFATRHISWIIPTFLALLILNTLYFFWAAGRLMKEEVVSVRAVRLHTMPAAAAWKTLTSWSNFTDWRSDIVSVASSDGGVSSTNSSSIHSKKSANSKDKDAVSEWIEVGQYGAEYAWKVLEHNPKELLQVRSGMPLPTWSILPWNSYYKYMAPKWTIEVRPPSDSAATGCIVYVTEQLTVSAPFVRFTMAMWGYGKGVDRYLSDLINLVGEKSAQVRRPVNGKLTIGTE